MSVLLVLSKILEKAVFDQIQDYVSLNNLISNYQHAFRKGCTAHVQH